MSFLRFTIVFLAIAGLTPASAEAQAVITTVAGAPFFFRGDGGPAVAASLGSIGAVAVDAGGNVFAADRDNHIVVKISAAGTLTVVAGNGINGFSGDGGPATSASLSFPSGVAVDWFGNVYIATSTRIRKVIASGTITTLAGNGAYGFSGDGGSAINAMMWGASGLAADAIGNVYFADSVNNRIRKISPIAIITTVAGNGKSGFSGDGGSAVNATIDGPAGVAVDATGNLYIADRFNHRIRKVSVTGTITTVAGNGAAGFSGDGLAATSASLFEPRGIAVDTAGNLTIADGGNHRVRRVNTAGVITTLAGNGAASYSGDGGSGLSAALNEPNGVALDLAGRVYIADARNQRVRAVTAAGIVSTLAGNGLYKFSGDGGPAISASLNHPGGVAAGPGGQLYVADTSNHRARRVDSRGVIASIAGNGVAGFSGDGGPATTAALRSPAGMAVDATGNIYIADTGNQRVRKVSAAGIMSTFAGNGTAGFSGDGGMAAYAALNTPSGVAVDGAGNLYIADAGNDRVRKVTPGGIISTVAGNGVPGFGGDGGPATAAALSFPTGVATDAVGNLYIADTNNFRVRKVNSNGTISTLAGNGTRAYWGDGGPPASASLINPQGVAVDTAGNVYIADKFDQRIRLVPPGGNISTFAGNGSQGFAGDGGPATAATLGDPSGVAADATGNLYVADSLNDRIRMMLTARPSFTVSPATLRFSATAGASVVAAQQIAVASPVTGLAWTAQVSTQDGGTWLAISSASGSAPAVIAVSVSIANLSAGTYRGTIAVQCPLAVPSTAGVSIELTIAPAAAPQLSLQPSALTVEAQAGAGMLSQALSIGNAGGGALNWTAQVVSGGDWLSISSASGSASSQSPSVVQVLAKPGSLRAGVYSGTVQVSSATTGETKAVAVTLLLSQPTQTILLSQSGLSFTGVAGGNLVPGQSFGVLNTGQGTMNWTARSNTLSGGRWLTVLASAGSSTANSLQVPSVDVNVDVSGVSLGQYSGIITIEAPGANNSPQFVTVMLNVLPAGGNPGVVVRPTGMIFVRQAGTSSPGSQAVRLETAAPGNLAVVANPATFRGGDWLDGRPRNLVISPGNPGTITVQPNLGSLAAGEYFGGLTLMFGDLSSQVVNTLFAVVAPSSGTSADGFAPAYVRASDNAETCVPGRLYLTPRVLGTNFAVAVAWPNLIQIQIKDNCDNLVANAIVLASFSNGDPLVPLVSLRNGIYEGTWQPQSSAEQVRITFTAKVTGLTDTQLQTQVIVNRNPMSSAPVLAAGGIVNGASFAAGAAVAPGSIISVFGRNMATGNNYPGALPLPTTLGGATLNVGGQDVPLFYAGDGQINAHVPFELAPNRRPQVLLKTRIAGTGVEVATKPETVTLAEFSPGIFSLNQAGSGQGAIHIASTGEVAAPAGSVPARTARPARRGEFLSIYCTGLGQVNNAPKPGAPALSDPLSLTSAQPAVVIGGVPARVDFSGLAPTFIGLYQVNVQVPADAPSGDNVPVVLTVGGMTSNTVTVAVQ